MLDSEGHSRVLANMRLIETIGQLGTMYLIAIDA